jgi:hypothetical protein
MPRKNDYKITEERLQMLRAEYYAAKEAEGKLFQYINRPSYEKRRWKSKQEQIKDPPREPYFDN